MKVAHLLAKVGTAPFIVLALAEVPSSSGFSGNQCISFNLFQFHFHLWYYSCNILGVVFSIIHKFKFRIAFITFLSVSFSFWYCILVLHYSPQFAVEKAHVMIVSYRTLSFRLSLYMYTLKSSSLHCLYSQTIEYLASTSTVALLSVLISFVARSN